MVWQTTKKQYGGPIFEPEVCRKQMFIEESNDIVGAFLRPPQSFGARGIVPSLLPPIVTPLTTPSLNKTVLFFKELASLGLDRLKSALMALNLKCGGTLEQRADRLFGTKGKNLDELKPSLFSKSKTAKK